VDLVWWVAFLVVGGGRFAHVTKLATLVPTSWGDGSGAGTDGTYQLPLSESFEECQPVEDVEGQIEPYCIQSIF
jgi:hypothetical protein